MITRREALLCAAGALVTMAAKPAGHIRSGYATVPGGKIWWQQYGNGSGTPLLLLHGGPGAAHNYLLPLRALADERPVIFYDQLGCGRSDAPSGDAPYHIERYVKEVDAVRDALGLDTIILYGHSWGTMLAMEYLITGHGRGVEKLMLGGALASVPQFVAGTVRMVEQLPNGAGKRLLALNASGDTQGAEYQRLIDLFYSIHVLRTAPNADVRASFAAAAKSPAYAIMNGPNEITVTGNLKHWDRRKDLGSITVPTLLLTGQYDEASLDCHETIHHGIKGSQLQIMPNCSHLAMQEAPAAYNRALRSFMSA